MSNDNLISATLSEQDAQVIAEAINLIRGKLPFLKSLTPQERLGLTKMGDKSMGFDEKCTLYMSSHNEFVPGFIDADELARDRVLRAQILPVWNMLNALTQNVDDTLMMVNQDIMMANLAFYQNVREAAKRGRPGAQSLFEDLRTRFPGGKRTPATPTPASN